MSDTATRTRKPQGEPVSTTFPAVPPLIVTEAATPAEAAQPTIPKRAESPPKKKKRGPDPEIQALAQLDRIMAELSPAAASRCIAWLDEKYDARWMKPQPVADPDFPHAGP